ncbi:MAG: tRNA (adenosine(37)-N6)-threonylcarbamoyltransferase complex ATPase subunit type 1 TsaE [Verrucomicrobia bacterium]|nr:tRNA (adenosine(37)-N6)-threonylcarbamoyltransferase complex ATPase subunit type 1 TsaE [Verrucomicrobiota bacterium]MBS0647117.1 tRNA (adenosine(37)-N6)-threonylcarbamoyltransferase complex ATPase subunit type 1 TsaE [Verrucomicrobiota bacterium]
MGGKRRIITSSQDETIELGRQIASWFPEGGIFCLKGDLGSGKTSLVKGIVAAVTTEDPLNVTSPTFSYLNIYDRVYHFDLYRLTHVQQFYDLGLQDYLLAEGFVCIEWSERIASLLPKNVHTILFEYVDEHTRVIEVLCA